MNKKNGLYYLLAALISVICAHVHPDCCWSKQSFCLTPAAAPEKTFHSIQACALSSESAARSLAGHLAEKGYPAYIHRQKTGRNHTLYKIRIGAYETKEQAAAAADLVNRQENMACFVVASQKTPHPVRSMVAAADSTIEKQHAQKHSRTTEASAESRNRAATVRESFLDAWQNLLAGPALFDFRLQADPRFSWQLYHEDNISGSGSRELDDFSNRYRPYLKINLDSSRFAIELESKLIIKEYMREREFNTVDQDHLAKVSFIPNKRTSLFFSIAYTVDSDLDSFLEQEAVGLEAAYNVQRYKNKTRLYSVGGNYNLSARSNLDLLSSLSSFETGATNDSYLYTATLQYTYTWSRRCRFNISTMYSYFDFSFKAGGSDDMGFLEDVVLGDAFELFFDSDYELQTYNLTGGFDYKISKDCTLTFRTRASVVGLPLRT